jgi:hypothetical protein
VKEVGSLVAAASILVVGIASAKCASMSTRDRFLEAKTVVLVSIAEAHDGPVPWPYGLYKGAIPGRLLTLRVVRSWKGSRHPEDVVYGWARGPKIEDAYPHTDVGTQILVFYYQDDPYEISSCNTADPSHLREVSDKLDALVRDQVPSVDPNNRLERP